MNMPRWGYAGRFLGRDGWMRVEQASALQGLDRDGRKRVEQASALQHLDRDP